MSQLFVFDDPSKDPMHKPIMSAHDLESIFVLGEKKKDEAKIGLEYELLVFDSSSLKPLPFCGPKSIQTFFSSLVSYFSQKKLSVKKITEEENIVALSLDHAVIALEPGGQVEIALSPYTDYLEAFTKVKLLLSDLQHVAIKEDILLASIGMQPIESAADMEPVQKKRYKIMHAHMKRNFPAGRGLDMMMLSAAVQVNIDYFSRKDLKEKLFIASCLSPILAAVFSFSPFVHGKKSLYKQERMHIWHNTDPTRVGVPEIFFAKDLKYKDIIEEVLKVPMYFIRKGDTYIDVSGQSFDTFIKNGLCGHQALFRDFIDHMSTVFWDIRLKPHIEIRTPDSVPLCIVKIILELIFKSFYNEENFLFLQKIFSNVTYEDITKLNNDIIYEGMNAKLLQKPIAQIFLSILNQIGIKDFKVDIASTVEKMQSILDITNKSHLQKYLTDCHPLGQLLCHT